MRPAPISTGEETAEDAAADDASDAGEVDSEVEAGLAPDLGSPLLPCDVRAALANRCVHCHSSPPSAGALISLLSRHDFLARSSLRPNLGVADVSLTRMRDEASPMPPRSEPDGGVAEHETIMRWIERGLPVGDCEPLPAKPLPVTCTSQQVWTQGNLAKLSMNPGLACRACHLETEPDRAYFFTGTVYSTFHEADLCNGKVPPGTRIEILDTTGTVQLTLPVDPSGNFSSGSVQAGVPVPYRARVFSVGGARDMVAPQVDGDCNKCHSEQGDSNAPGRIVAPPP